MHIRSLLAGVGVAAVVGVGALVAVDVASADPGSGSTSSAATTSSTPSSAASCPRADLRKEVADYLAAHPDVKAELQKIRSLPQDQRAAERKQYLAAHPDVAAQLATFRKDRRSAWWEVAGNESAVLSAHPDLADLFKAVGAAPAGQRQAAAQAYLAQHPDVKAELQQLRKEHRQACQAGK